MTIAFEERGDGAHIAIDRTNTTAEAREQAREGSTMILASLAARIEA